MYLPPLNAVHDEAQTRAMVAAARTGWLVTVDRDGVPLATLLPIMWAGERVVATWPGPTRNGGAAVLEGPPCSPLPSRPCSAR